MNKRKITRWFDLGDWKVEATQCGKKFKAICPFHAEKIPSLVIDPDKKTFHCLGCGKEGKAELCL